MCHVRTEQANVAGQARRASGARSGNCAWSRRRLHPAGYPFSIWRSNRSPSTRVVCYRCPVRKPTPAFSRPIPHLLDLDFHSWPELRLRDQPLGNIKHIRCPHSTRDDPLVQPRSRDDQDFPANVASNIPRKGSAFSKPRAMRPTLDRLKDAHARALPSA
jgi:hypothetical protein